MIERPDLAELARPWKLATLAIGMAWLLYGALNYAIADWDVGISLLMGGLAYVLAPWSVRLLVQAVRERDGDSPRKVMLALLAAWLVVDGVYVTYHTLLGNRMFREDNFYASSALYFLAGFIWLYRGSLKELLRTARAALAAASRGGGKA